MHYIRFLKSPKIHLRNGLPVKIASTISITTDLGEFYFEESIEIDAQIVDHSNSSLLAKKKSHRLQNEPDGESTDLDRGPCFVGAKTFLWKGNGQRALSIEIPYQPRDLEAKVAPKKKPSSPQNRSRIADSGRGENETNLDDKAFQLHLQLNVKDPALASTSINSWLVDGGPPGNGMVYMPLIIPVTMQAVLEQPPTAKRRRVAPVFAERLLNFEKKCLKADDQAEYDMAFKVLEETGDSIARHVWDSGLALIANMNLFFAYVAPCLEEEGTSHSTKHFESSGSSESVNREESGFPWKPSPKGRLPSLDRLLADHATDHGERLNILELGAGTGSVGLWFKYRFPYSSVLLTDLPDAQEIAEANIEALLSNRAAFLRNKTYISASTSNENDNPNANTIATNDHTATPTTATAAADDDRRRQGLKFYALDWTEPSLPASYSHSSPSPPSPSPSSSSSHHYQHHQQPQQQQQQRQFDLIVASDCIYNTDSIPLLVSTLTVMSKHSPASRILISTKRRHASEVIFFDLMAEAGMTILERATVSCPMALRPLIHHRNKAANADANNTKNTDADDHDNDDGEDDEHQKIHLFLFSPAP